LKPQIGLWSVAGGKEWLNLVCPKKPMPRGPEKKTAKSSFILKMKGDEPREMKTLRGWQKTIPEKGGC